MPGHRPDPRAEALIDIRRHRLRLIGGRGPSMCARTTPATRLRMRSRPNCCGRGGYATAAAGRRSMSRGVDRGDGGDHPAADGKLARPPGQGGGAAAAWYNPADDALCGLSPAAGGAIRRLGRSVAQPGRALCSGRRGRRFESSHSDQPIKRVPGPVCRIAMRVGARPVSRRNSPSPCQTSRTVPMRCALSHSLSAGG